MKQITDLVRIHSSSWSFFKVFALAGLPTFYFHLHEVMKLV